MPGAGAAGQICRFAPAAGEDGTLVQTGMGGRMGGMTRTARRARFVLAGLLPFLFALSACTEEGDGSAGGGDRVNSSRYALESGGAGGAGGLGGATAESGEPIRICTTDVVLIDDLPECFVAEVSTLPLDCTTPGHEELRPEWEESARKRECEYRSLDQEACAALSLCGIEKASGTALTACQAGSRGAEPGYCVVNQRSEGCNYAEVDTLLVYGANADADALHVSCAIVGVE